MKSNIISAAILALGLIAAAYVNGGRYEYVRANEKSVIIGDRLTGKTKQIVTTSAEDWLSG